MASIPTTLATGSHHRGSRVHVGVRIRPLTSQEINAGGKSSLRVDSPSIRMGKRSFTYDAVFDESCGQKELYDMVSGPLLSSFVDGYNATIMSYGQTGSGKTYTMGSEAHTEPESSSQSGLIPRFITDFFLRLQQKKDVSDNGVGGNQVLLEYSLKASFLEVYGEDVYDLLDSTRKSLPLREDSEKGIVVVGLKSRPISNTAEALQVLHEGTMNRTTAATLMNLTSSRSHAVFTVQLVQVTNSKDAGKVDVATTSCFTFVDLAGSERMKKTGAEGERAREGIKINEGLLALGNVINALADEKRIAKEKKIHVPYRQSKLTRLLQDALGGNSQTLFLACVSPSDTNASETLSTLNYANRARNIRNIPKKNIDATVAELQRLYAINQVLQCELIKIRFQVANDNDSSEDTIGKIDYSLMKRQDVEEYIEHIYEVAQQMTSPCKPASLKSASICPSLDKMDDRTRTMVKPLAIPSTSKGMEGKSDKFDQSVFDDVNPDEEMAILDYLLELQQQDQEFENEKESDDAKLKEMDRELEKEESMLLQLRESLKFYHGLKGRYEELMAEVQQMETEKRELANQLQQATVDPSTGCSVAIKKKLERVEISLSHARRETLTHRENHRRAEDQNKKCSVLERRVHELKHAKTCLLKKQKEMEACYRDATETKTKELMVLRRREKVADKKMSKLELEVKVHKSILAKRNKYCTKLSDKLKQAEAHLVKLLVMRQKDLASRSVAQTDVGSHSTTSVYGRVAESGHNAFSLTEDDSKSFAYIFDRMVLEKAKQCRLKKRYGDLVKLYSENMRNLVQEIKKVSDARRDSLDDSEDRRIDAAIASEREELIADLELKVELLDEEMREISSQIPSNVDSSLSRSSEAVTKMMMGMSTSKLRALLMDTFSKFVLAETERQSLKENLDRKQSALLSCEAEVDSLTLKAESLVKDLAARKTFDESGQDPHDMLQQCTSAQRQLHDELLKTKKLLEESQAELSNAQIIQRSVNEELMVVREKLALVQARQNRDEGTLEAQETVEKLQDIWAELGVESSMRDKANNKIERCLEDTCERELNKALSLKTACKEENDTLAFKLVAMRSAMGMDGGDDNSQDPTLLSRLNRMRAQVNSLETPYRFSTARREKILKELKELMTILRIDEQSLTLELQQLLQSERPHEAASAPAPADKGFVVPFVTFPSGCLEPTFLSRCENHVRKLRVQKAVALNRNRELQQESLHLMNRMHLSSSDAIALINDYVQKHGKTILEWWDIDCANQIVEEVSAKRFVLNPSEKISGYLEWIVKSLNHATSCRRSVSTSLKSTIEHTQKILLDIVGREFDASEAYAGFHDALFRLPELSKDLILSCVSEMEALVDGVDSMTQSEIEALTVVWEALSIPASDRRNFWGDVEKSGSLKPSCNAALFQSDTMAIITLGEDWLLTTARRASEVFVNLHHKLEKLGNIHKVVERLRSKQDNKSKILSLDSEIRIMNAKLLHFEEHCHKHRLLSKKTSGGMLLKEERFRKQMRAKFVSNLRELATLLQIWETSEESSFDASLLSDDVRMLLKDSSQAEKWVDERTKFMGLRAVKSHTPLKRNFAMLKSDSESYSGRAGLTPPRKRASISRSDQRVPAERIDELSVSHREKLSKQNQHTGKQNLRVRDTNVAEEPKRGKRKDTSLRPFQNILGDLSPSLES